MQGLQPSTFNLLVSVNWIVFGINQPQELLLDLDIKHFPLQLGVLRVVIKAAQEPHWDFKASCHHASTAKEASITILTKGFFDELVGVECQFVGPQGANHDFYFFVFVVNNPVDNSGVDVFFSD